MAVYSRPVVSHGASLPLYRCPSHVSPIKNQGHIIYTLHVRIRLCEAQDLLVYIQCIKRCPKLGYQIMQRQKLSVTMCSAGQISVETSLLQMPGLCAARWLSLQLQEQH